MYFHAVKSTQSVTADYDNWKEGSFALVYIYKRVIKLSDVKKKKKVCKQFQDGKDFQLSL